MNSRQFADMNESEYDALIDRYIERTSLGYGEMPAEVYWESFEIGESHNFEDEVKATAENKALMSFLAERKSDRDRVPLSHVKDLLELD